MNFKNLIYAGVILIVILLGLWGYYFYNRGIQNIKPEIKANLPATQTPQSGNSIQNSGVINTYNTESDLLKYFAIPNPSEKEIKSFNTALDKFAKQTNNVNVSKCESSPLVVKIQTGQGVTFRNNDSADLKILIRKDSYSVSPGQTVNAKPNLPAGVYGYFCEGKGFEDRMALGFLAGILYIVE
ncbi:hypothetical protein A3F00_03920 [Candidatus Daviesbacteria bacterium RIFCSPHIGHO2_12_FULL_37_11]|uniref:Uncharacterized protein n=1 Tax=Candidatus Daviesbacteria bacterium RIFCSPHIGHO2_12_FULL_37_11 TaxID=1797777 RepID=A0A1F5KB96_9BACT|nr:MAG: hypothetical protein A2769_01830 [Candidatus Daviesbacteria bacterium RIFCSPHIGHO2_01_FULL_37_27]OGE38138.1 MAG: hypothetical protein A3F00_03920 [Candidatus Daviesbacteria bacterium RIFCSPHIGHO2_12_FULL_37_11]OGE45341.1 MAG: hypothetical protein A3B39_01370 [Candidatus Daviesbacteria bacterium RIFCSPLOWO2_01_FULL_37_10]